MLSFTFEAILHIETKNYSKILQKLNTKNNLRNFLK